jgi:hypothetical protein
MSRQSRHPRGGNNRNPDAKIDVPRGQTGSREIREPENPDDEGRTPNEPVRDEDKKEE